MNTDRIRTLAKSQGKSVTYICSLIDRRKYYLNDIDKKDDRMISDEDLKTLAINLGTTVAYLKGETDDPQFHLSSVGLITTPCQESGKRPIFGHASAGKGVIAQQEALGYEQVDPEYDSEDFFWLQVDGDSMSPVLDDGDLVLVHKGTPVETDTLMVVLIDDDEGFVKKVCINDDTVTLHSFNPQYPPRVFGGSDIGRLRFVGRVMELKRRF